jgi:hypothetical protein
MLGSFKRHFTPFNKVRQNKVLLAWILASRKLKRGISIIKWIYKLELAYNKVVKYNLLKV